MQTASPSVFQHQRSAFAENRCVSWLDFLSFSLSSVCTSIYIHRHARSRGGVRHIFIYVIVTCHSIIRLMFPLSPQLLTVDFILVVFSMQYSFLLWTSDTHTNISLQCLFQHGHHLSIVQTPTSWSTALHLPNLPFSQKGL